MVTGLNIAAAGVIKNKKAFDKNSEAILKNTTTERKESAKTGKLVENLVDRIEISGALKLNSQAVKTNDKMLGELIDLKK